MDKRVILVIDDERNVCTTVKDALERLGGFKVLTANNGFDGFKMTRDSNPDLVLLDINMPVMNGFDVLDRIKTDDKTFTIPVVMLTGQKDDAHKIAASRLYCEDYVTKPVSLAALKGKIDTIFARFGA